ncbi:hypothetical protein Scep_029085 [Stephania cephalantha]|uniref:Xyloglucan endotransglucosylase/hydrolase n=1 Tax=Stephania cephalantha TaxID=152367 RepID=A0AAP0E4K5_9MAGN
MASFASFLSLLLLLHSTTSVIFARKLQSVVAHGEDESDYSSFDEKYAILWGNDHVSSFNQGKEIQLSLDISSGAGFVSKTNYSSGFFHMRIKLPPNDSAGVVTAYYLTSQGPNHDELDFEFLGNKEGKPITLQTNVFANGVGGREQRIILWFDPREDFHSYKVLWNPHQIVFFVDDTPIRVFKNNTDKGVAYPWQPMQIQTSLWDGEAWATDGGMTKTDWAHAPFKANFRGFNIDGCPVYASNTQPCYSTDFWWNGESYWTLSPSQQKAYEIVKSNYINYDYCSDRDSHPTAPLECPQ